MKKFSWDDDKNRQLKEKRGVSFEDILQTIDDGQLLDIIKNPNLEKYPNQYTLIVRIEDYVYCVPYVENEYVVFLKTIFPRRLTKWILCI